MCDYSQHLTVRQLCTRRAMVGDELELVTIFGVRGFAKRLHGRWSLTCLRPGTEVAFDKRQVLRQCRSFVECDNGERILVNDIMPKEARFCRVPGGGDGLEFSNGLQCGLIAIDFGARIRVLQLPAVKHRRKQQAEARTLPAQQERELVPVTAAPAGR